MQQSVKTRETQHKQNLCYTVTGEQRDAAMYIWIDNVQAVVCLRIRAARCHNLV